MNIHERNKERNIAPEFWRYVEGQDTKIAKRVYDWLDRDNLSAIIISGDIYWFELTSSYATMPNYVYYYIKRWCKRQGYEYLYDKFPVK